MKKITLKELVPSRIVRVLLIPVTLAGFLLAILYGCGLAFIGERRKFEKIMEGYINFIDGE